MASQFAPPVAPRRLPATNALALFPGALGDFLCCLPALLARRQRTRGRFVVVARWEWLQLIKGGPFELRSIDAPEVAELYSAAPPAAPRVLLAGMDEVHSWSGYGDEHFARCLREAGERRRAWVYPFRDLAPGEHAAEYYARCLKVKAAPMRVFLDRSDREWARQWLHARGAARRALLCVHAGSGSPQKNWAGFAAAVAWWRAQAGLAVEIVGPAERGVPRIGADAVLAENLRRVAAVLERAVVYAGNDSGVTHLAAAVGTPGIAIFRPAAVAHWRPRSALLDVIESAAGCCQCADSLLCVHRVPVAKVLAALARRRSQAGGASAAASQRWHPGQ